MPARLKRDLERHVERPVVGYAKSLGVLAVKQTHQGAPSHPDRAFYFDGGRLLQVEFKAPGGLPTKLQANTIIELRSRGFDVQIIDDAEKGFALIDAYAEHRHVAGSEFDKFTIAALKKVIGRTPLFNKL